MFRFDGRSAGFLATPGFLKCFLVQELFQSLLVSLKRGWRFLLGRSKRSVTRCSWFAIARELYFQSKELVTIPGLQEQHCSFAPLLTPLEGFQDCSDGVVSCHAVFSPRSRSAGTVFATWRRTCIPGSPAGTRVTPRLRCPYAIQFVVLKT